MSRGVRMLAGVAAGAAVLGAAGLGYELARLPSSEQLRAGLVARYPKEAVSGWRPLAAISPQLKETVVVWEDPTFYHHNGVSYSTIVHAAAIDLRRRRYARGGSTITQQVAKNLFLTREKTLRRKLDDAIIAQRLETVLSKEEILEVYLNTAEWGEGIYGAEAAARHYFGTSAGRLDWGQAALLAALLPNPRVFDPCGPMRRETLRRRDVILRILAEEGLVEPGATASSDDSGLICEGTWRANGLEPSGSSTRARSRR